MTDAQARRLLARLRNVLWKCALRKWVQEGWTIQPHLECSGAERHLPGTGTATLAWLDEEEHVCHVYTHPKEFEQPVAKTLLHEMAGHILLDLDSTKAQEQDVEEIEDILWTCLTPKQKQILKNLTADLKDPSAPV